MKYELLGDIVEVSKGKKHNPVEHPSLNSKRIIGINDLRNDNVIVLTDDNNGVEAYEKDILIAWDGANAGTIGYGKKGYIGSTISRLRIKNTKKYSETFIGKLLQSKFNYLRSTATGATIPHINRAALDSIKIPQFDLSDQIRIATILTRAEVLIAKRKESIKALDELIKSTFLEMFGDLVRNEKGWENTKLGNISDIQGGLQVTTKRAINPIELPYLRVANVYRDLLDLREVKTIKVTEAEAKRVCLKKGDILVVEGHGNPKEIGRSAVWDGSINNCLHQNHLIRVRVDTNYVLPVFISNYINSSSGRKQMFKAGKTTSGLNTISSKNVKDTLVLLPPLPLQNQFTAIVEKVGDLKARYTLSLTELENLYGSLSQRAFKGELDLSKVPVVYETEVEVGEVVEMTGRMNMELKTKPEFTDKDLVVLIKKYSGKIFSFDELWKEIETLTDKKAPSRNDIQNRIIMLLESDQINFQQVFDILTSQDNIQYSEKQIAFRSNYEN
ncbi:restriction endonuclease subunit S [Paenibacillus sp. PL91]|uniref:restriction endonuclease subunit S n=1 Tax=Paenibacillus sp. PL91 TaxID=2729538 RepID=UPI00145CD380|nr:restriction endonuclease subunit S [Paenibacillus sp. PL91]MBC9205013.1 restriction endonuclease subunit S [Paenibacillus sp. PL91]